tara:strand:- start:1908 stop:2582 length:675 start_codon:yes stop_codon:yes gene_type:complete
MSENNDSNTLNLKGFYINLDERVDRKEHFEKLKTKFDFLKGIERMKAVKNNIGAIGCAMSHIKCMNELLNKCKNDKNDYVAIFEDDFCLLNEVNFEKFIEAFDKIKNEDWDVIVLTPRGNTIKTEDKYSNHEFLRIIEAQTMTGYIVKVSFLNKLSNLIKIGIENMIKGDKHDNNACDQIWKKLQTEHKFIYYKHIYGGQLQGWSDLEKRMVNYNRRFLLQNHY